MTSAPKTDSFPRVGGEIGLWGEQGELDGKGMDGPGTFGENRSKSGVGDWMKEEKE